MKRHLPPLAILQVAQFEGGRNRVRARSCGDSPAQLKNAPAGGSRGEVRMLGAQLNPEVLEPI